MFSGLKMKSDAVTRLLVLLTVCICAVQSQTVPVLTPLDLQAKITTNSVILQQPHCYFNQTCPDCQIWLVASLASATNTFTADSTNPNILSLSPYTTAFNNGSRNYFLNPVGPLSAFPCNASSDALYFQVGADGNCFTTNCNGILPVGSTVSFKYLLVNGSTVINQTDWSANITLITPQNPQSINDGLSGRSAAMIVITSILATAAALLLLFFFIMLCVACCHKTDSKPITVKSSLRMPHYDTHNLQDRVHPYDNPAYELERKKQCSGLQ